MRTREQIENFFEGDRYVILSSIQIGEVSETEASAFVCLAEKHLNAGNTAQGGLIYTLMDFAFALVANNSEGSVTVTQSATVSYLNPPKGTKLVARACLKKEGRMSVVCSVNVKDDKGVNVAEGLFNGFRRSNS